MSILMPKREPLFAPAVSLVGSAGIVGVAPLFHFVNIWDRAATIIQSASASHVVALPTCQPGDVLLHVMGVDQNENITWPEDSPTEDGWVRRVQNVEGESTYAMATKIAEESDSAGSVTVTISSSEQGLHQVFALNGLAGVASIEGKASVNGQTTDDWAFPSLSPSIIEHWKFIAVLFHEDNRTPTAPSSYIEEKTHAVSGAGDDGASLTTWLRDFITAVAEQPGNVTISSVEEGTTQTLGLKPTAGDLYESQVAMVIQNPGAEDGTNFWTSTVGGLANRASNPDPFVGSSYFTGGTDPQTNAFQDIPIPSSLLAAADSNRLRAEINWQANSFAGADDCRINLSWFDDESPENLIGIETLGKFVSPNQEWVAQQDRHAAPSGARALRIEMDINRDSGTNNDGYVDDIQGTWLVDPA